MGIFLKNFDFKVAFKKLNWAKSKFKQTVLIVG